MRMSWVVKTRLVNVDIDKADFQVQNFVLETDATSEVERIDWVSIQMQGAWCAKEELAPVYTQALQGVMYFLEKIKTY